MAVARRKYGLNPIAFNLHNSTLYEPQRQNHFELYIMLPIALTNGDPAKADQLAKYITLAVESFSLPQIQVSNQDISYGNTKIHLAGGVTFSGANSLTVIDYIGADIEGIMYSWQNLVYNPETGQMGWAYNYKTTATLVEYAGDGSCIASWILQGVWPGDINYGSTMSKGDASIKKITATIFYDVAYRKFGSSNRNTHGTMANTALQNMIWKPQDEYQDGENLNANNGGPLNHIQDNLGN